MASLELHALGLLCGLGAAGFATFTDTGWRSRALFAGAFLATTLLLGPSRFPGPTWVASVTVVAAAATLWRPAWSGVAVAWGGILGGFWVSVLAAQGLPFSVAAVVAVAVPAVAAGFAGRRADFATPKLREEALIVLIAFGLLLATTPEIAAGWRSALALKAVPLAAEQPGGTGWALAIVGFCALIGGLYSLWRRR